MPDAVEIALDIGHSSVGWAVFKSGSKFELVGTGVVLFPANGCLAVKRRAYRRQRRHVRATRQRIERLRRLLEDVGALTAEGLSQPGCAWPWKLAAEATSDNARLLTWRELWDVVRWYAHNRGYDGNIRWSRSEEAHEDDTKKERNALALMQEHGTTTMAATFCAVLRIDPLAATNSSRERFKGLNAAFPRAIVYAEVKGILDRHVGRLAQLTPDVVRALVGQDDYAARQWDEDAWKAIPVPRVRFAKRYRGSYLFGQSLPRFDNRIISSCPITYQRVLAETGDRRMAARESKVPVKKCREFLLYRWAMILANLRVDKGRGMEPLTGMERKMIHAVMVRKGHLTKRELKKALIEAVGVTLANNLETCFLAPRAEDALILRPEKPPPGRAPYTRQVMKEAIREVFAGKHPTEKGNCLYPGEEVREAQLQRTLEEKTNNHLVRHRVLITRRLVRDITRAYLGADLGRVERITIEVNPDLQAFSGKTNKEVESELHQMLKDHGNVVSRLKRDLAGTSYQISAGLIRKARVAEDLDWTCPYSQKRYGAIELASGAFDKDHIIPRSQRPSDSLDSLVITSKAINAMKGNRTALQFIKEFGGQDIEGDPGVGAMRSNLMSESAFRKFVDSLNTRASHRQDVDRKRRRKALLVLERYEDKEFLPKDLTQTSHLVRLAAAELAKEFGDMESQPRIISLPGSVTGEVRKAWKLYGCLAAHNPEVQKLLQSASAQDINIKKEMRGLTHLHHALDACVIGFASHFLPNDGGLWAALVKRHRRPEETNLLLTRSIFSRDSDGRAGLAPLGDAYKRQITERLGECRVVQHIPKRMSGLVGLEENTRGIVAIEVPDPTRLGGPASEDCLEEIWNHRSGQPLPAIADLDHAVVRLRQFGPRDPKNQERRVRKPTREKAAKLLGLRPEAGDGKLRAIKGVRIIDANFGLAVWRRAGKPAGELIARVIVWHKVWPQLDAIATNENGGKWPQVFRKGQVISVPTARGRSDYRGYWQIASIKNNDGGAAFDLIRPDMVKLQNKVKWSAINVSVATLVRCGMTPVKSGLTGVALNP